MALDNDALQTRIETIELWINAFQTSLNNLATRREMKNLYAVIASQISSLQDVVGTIDATGALYPPRVTTTERDALTVTKGAVVTNLTTGKLNFYNGSSWEEVTSS